MPNVLHRAVDKVRLPYRSRRFRAALDIQPRPDLVGIADPTYGGYVVPSSLLGSESVVFLCGTGTDITFDLDLIARFGCRVLAMDPVPAAAEYVATAAADEPRHEFLPYALWNEDTELTFHAPRVAGYISHSATDMHGTEVAFTAVARRLATLAGERGVDHVDLLKISAEGSEYTILDDVLDSGIPVTIIAVEFATPVKPAVPLAHVAKLTAAGYQLVAAHTADYNWKLTFVRD